VSMVTVGIDPHKSTLTAVAVDEVGRQLAQITVPNRDEGFVRLRCWCTRFDTLPLFAVEDGRGVASRLVSALLATGAQVVWVPPKLMTQVRASARTRGKSDAIDALAVARAALREPDLPHAQLDEQAVELELVKLSV
jgi:transposase